VQAEAVQVHLLGGFSVAVGDRLVEERAWPDGDAATLVKALALAPDRRLGRPRLAELIEADDARLERALEAARDAINANGVVEASGDALALHAAVDAATFQAAAAHARAGNDPDAYERALHRYHGTLLPGDDAAWVARPRAALAQLHTSLCIELAELLGVGERARAALDRAVDADPLDQDAHRALMRLFARGGRRQRAIAQYHVLRQALLDRDGSEPDRRTRALYQALLPAPPMTSAVPPPPKAPTSFVGRARELAEVARTLETARLVTLTGPGGCGKSRLALEAIGALGGLAPDGGWVVGISRVGDDAQVAEGAAIAVGLPLPAHRPAQEALAAHLAERAVVVVLDGCDHALAGSARLAAALVEAGPGVHVLAASREPLRCPGEVVWRVPPLAEAYELFVERAGAARPGFRATADDASLIERICQPLDGLPLAVELAAARTATHSLHRIAVDLRVRLGVAAAATRADRMQAVLEWSHDLLTSEERVLLRRLAVFAGGATVQAAREVCAGGAIERRRVAELMTRLVDRALVVADGERFLMRDPVRRFAASHLAAAGERETVEIRHLDWAAQLAAEHDPLDGGRRPPQALEPEIENLRAALAFAVRREPQTALRLATRLRRFWIVRGRVAEGRRWLDACMAAAPATSTTRVEALLACAGLALRSGEAAECLRRVRPALAAYDELGEDREVARALYRHALLEQASGGDGGPSFARALELARRSRDRRLLAAATHASALEPWLRGDFIDARARVMAALDLLEAAPAGDDRPFFDGVALGVCLIAPVPGGRPRLAWEEHALLFDRFAREPAIAYALNNAAWAARQEGDLTSARAALAEALGRFRESWDRSGEAFTLTHVGRLETSADETDEGRFHLTKALALRHRVGDRRGVVTTTTALGRLEVAAGDVEEGRRLLGDALARAEAVDDLPAMAGVQSEWAIAEETLEELPRAARLYDNAATLWRAIGLRRCEGWARLALGDVRLGRGDEARAQEAWRAAAQLLVACGDGRGAALATAPTAATAPPTSRGGR
jgi:predicted ATPase/DNA-binding SARP family transcriptional activator